MFPNSNLNLPGRKDFFLALISLQELIYLIEVRHFDARVLNSAKFYFHQLEQKQNVPQILDNSKLLQALSSLIEFYEQARTKEISAELNHWREVYERLDSQYEDAIFSRQIC